MIKYKQYLLLKEDPNEVGVNGKYKHYTDPDAIGFSMIDGLCVYGKFTHDTLTAALVMLFKRGNAIAKDIEASGISIEGEPNQKNLAIMQPLLNAPTFNREKVMATAPDIVLGRLWTQDKAISFWNPPNKVLQLKDQIIKFIEKFGQPTEFVYDINNKTIDFNSFNTGKINLTGKIDPSKVHTMAPGPARKQMQQDLGMDKAKFGSRSPDYPSARTRAMMYQSESFKEWLSKKEI